MNKHKVVLDILKNKILFIFKRYKYNDNKILAFKDLSFLLKTSLIIITRPFKLIIKNKSNENNFDINHFKNISNKKRSTSTLKTFKKKLSKNLILSILLKLTH